jgi:succinate dehydrogenase / fumarate reductase cytochrome b subunit
MEPILGLGFLIHIIWSLFLEYQNWVARPVKYAKKNLSGSSSWASRNMLILGALVLVFLIVHIINFFWVIKFQPEHLESFTNGEYDLVAGLFKESVIYGVLYIIGGILLGLHLSHGFWSAFHTLGLNNKHWLKRWQVIGNIYAIIVAVGFSIIPLYFMLGLYN